MTTRNHALAQFAIFDDFPDLVVVKDRSFSIVYGNRAFEKATGESARQATGRPDTDFIQPATESTNLRSLDERALAGETVHGERLELQSAAGVGVYDVHKMPVRDERGEVWAVLTIVRDATEAHRAEQARLAADARYRLLFENSPVGMYVHDGQKILYANRAFATLMGADDPSELVGYRILEIAHEDDRPRLIERLKQVRQGTGVNPLMSFRVRDLERRVRHVDVLATRCEYEGRPAVQVVMLDITERRQDAMDREALEAQLRHAQRLDALGRLASGIAHDFNNLLLIIKLHAQLLAKRIAPGESGEKDIDQMHRAIDRGTGLVRGILTFSRKQPLERRLARVADIVEESASLLRSSLPPRVTLDVDIAAKDAVVDVDPTQLGQAIINLATNAWQAEVPERAPRVRIAVDEVALDEEQAKRIAALGPGRYVRITVEDNGSGIDEATAKEIFDPFFTTKPTGEGTGLGLSAVDGIVRAHDGAVEMESTVGVGSTFRVFLPVARTRPTRVAPDQHDSTTAPRGIDVLLVDDEPAVLSSVRRLLESDGLRVRTADCLTAARAALAKGRFDVVVTDYNMPDGTGIELAEIVACEFPGLPVVLASGHLDEEVRASARSAGVRGYLLKPYTTQALIELIASAIEAARR